MQRDQVHWEDMEVGQEIPGYSIKIDATRVVLQVSGTQDYHPVHHDLKFAQAAGFPDVFVCNEFMMGCFNRLIWDWIGDEGWLRKLRIEMRKWNHPGVLMTLKGSVTGKYTKDSEHYVELDVWAENDQEGVSTPGKATVILPSRG